MKKTPAQRKAHVGKADGLSIARQCELVSALLVDYYNPDKGKGISAEPGRPYLSRRPAIFPGHFF